MSTAGWRGHHDYDVAGRLIEPCCQDCGHVFRLSEPLFKVSDLEWYCMPCARSHPEILGEDYLAKS